MIAYEELAAALERWRIRNGLPGTPPLFADGPMRLASAAAAAPAPPATYAPPPAYAPPVAAEPYAAPPERRAPPPPPPPGFESVNETMDEDVSEFAEADVVDEAHDADGDAEGDADDEAHLDTDGPDFAMSFATSPAELAARAEAAAMNDDDAREAALLGVTDPGIVPPPADAWPDAAGYQTGDAGGHAWGQPPGRAAATTIDDEGHEPEDGATIVGPDGGERR